MIFSSALDDERPSTLLINFGDDVILMSTVTKQLLITNQSAIPAPFTIEAEYFICSASKSNGQPEKRYWSSLTHLGNELQTQTHYRFNTGCILNCRSVYVKDELHLAQARKSEEKTHKG